MDEGITSLPLKNTNMLAYIEQRLFLFWVLSLGAVLFLAALPLSNDSQAFMVGILLVTAMLITAYSKQRFETHDSHKNYYRIAIIVVSVFVTLRYFFWRLTETIDITDLISLIPALILLLAELYGMTLYMLGSFVNIFPVIRKSPPLPQNYYSLPSVDVFIPSYNEDDELLEVTLLSATQISYPPDKLNVYLLDDGGTVAKRNHENPEKRQEAIDRHQRLQLMCERLGATYMTREKNNHAKAGNINSALENTTGEIVLILDADHVPTVDILLRTVGFFVRDPKLFLVQTPHYFVNPDPIEKNLGTFSYMPSENEMFYSVVQYGLDFWNASFFCGSAALLRRKYLNEVGGVAGLTITEDAETALSLHEKGYTSVYLGRPMVSGLQPETFSGFILQRVRWAQGMAQIFILKNPWRKNKLNTTQRLAYTSSSFFWFFPFARVTFFLAPLAFLVFGLQVYNATLEEFFIYALPHVIVAIMLSEYLFGHTRWPFVSELYETMQSLFSLVALVKVIRRPRDPEFEVTPKGEKLSEDFISSLAAPFYWLISLTLLALVAAVVRYYFFPDQLDIILITGFWAVFNLFLLVGALGALHEKKQRRTYPRVFVRGNEHAVLKVGRLRFECEVEDISLGGMSLVWDFPAQAEKLIGKKALLAMNNESLKRNTLLHVEIKAVFSSDDYGDGKRRLGLMFLPENLIERREIVSLVYGDSSRLKRNQEFRQQHVGIFKGLRYLWRISYHYGFLHLKFLLARILHLPCVGVWCWFYKREAKK